MNEEQKNIETCLAENILSEVASVPTDQQFRSLVDEALDPLKQQASAQAGYDGYEKVVWTHKPYTFTSQVKQMKSNIILLLRRLWRYPFGRGTSASSAAGSSATSSAAPIRSLSDMWQHYITRLKGNPEYGIPSRLSQLTDLPSAPALLADRDMSSGIRFSTNHMPDGMSLAQLLCSTSAASSVTEIVDINVGWTMDRAFSDAFVTPALKKVKFRCKQVSLPGKVNNTEKYLFHDVPELEDIEMTEFANTTFRGCLLIGSNKVKRLVLHYKFDWYAFNSSVSFISGTLLEELYIPIENWSGGYCFHNKIIVGCSTLKRFIAPYLILQQYSSLFYGCPNIEYVYVPSTKYIANIGYDGNNLSNLAYLKTFIAGGLLHYQHNTSSFMSFDGCPKLIHLEVKGSITDSTNIQGWSPTNALDASKTDLIEEGSTATNNLQQFLSNFKHYIAERLTEKGSGLTLTLSQEVRNAIHAAEDEYGIENIIITQKGWTISPAPN